MGVLEDVRTYQTLMALRMFRDAQLLDTDECITPVPQV